MTLGSDTTLAAEYVLGLLDTDERKAAQARLTEPEFARLVLDWENTFAHYADDYAPKTPPASVQRNLKARLFGQQKSFWQRHRFATAFGALAVSAVLLFTALPRTAFDPEYNATLTTPSGLISAEIDADTNTINVAFDGVLPTGNDLELWVISPEQAPVSLGLIKDQASFTFADSVKANLGTDSVLAISLEPKGGSPEAGPTGEVIATDTLKAI